MKQTTLAFTSAINFSNSGLCFPKASEEEFFSYDFKPTCMSSRFVIVLLGLVLLNSPFSYSQSRKNRHNNGKEPEVSIKGNSDTAKNKVSSVRDKTASSKKIPGLFTIYQDTTTGTVLLYITKEQLEKEFIYQSFSMGGPPELFLNRNMIRVTWIFALRKTFNKIEFIKQNTNYYYDPANAISKSANADVSEAIFYSEKVMAADADGYLINADGLFLSEKLDPIKPFLSPTVAPGAVFNLGNLNVAKSNYLKLRSFPKNTDVIVSLSYENPSPIKLGGKDITDARYVQVKMQHSFLEVPNNDFKPRFDDPRVGYFISEVNDMTTTRLPNYRDVISRWHLVKKDPKDELSEPVEPIVWWIENTTPQEIRGAIMQAGLKWNEAFEKSGFKNAVVIKQMPDTASWDPADIRYNVIRWVSSDLGFAIGLRFVNPRTGQILGADITIDYGLLVRSVSEDDTYALFTGQSALDENNGSLFARDNCSIAKGLKTMQGSALTIAEAFDAALEELATLKDQYLTYLILHEMGHTIGLNHNMKASTMLSPQEMNNKEITRKWGLTASVMEYPGVNINSEKSKQGDYYSTKTGPYDWWAIEYGYSQFMAGEEKDGLRKILGKSVDPKLAFGNDADMPFPGRGIDPSISDMDMSNDLVAYAEERLKTVNNAMTQLRKRFVKPSESYESLRTRHFELNAQRFFMTYNLSRQIGGIYVDRSFPEQKSPNKPFTPVPSSYQKSAMKILSKYIFSPAAFDSDKELLPYLQLQRRGFNFWGSTEDPKILTIAGSIQNTVFSLVLHPVTLNRITSTTLFGNTYTAFDVMTDLVKACFKDDLTTSVNVYRRNLQAELVQRLLAISSDPGKVFDPSANSAAFYNLKTLKATLVNSPGGDIETKAHRKNLIYLIEKSLTSTK